MASRDNLIPMNQRTEEEQRQLASLGGKKSGEARRAKRDMRESMRRILDMDITETQLKNLQSVGIDGSGWHMADLVNMVAVQMAIKGNVSAMAFVRDTAGYSPDLQLREEEFAYEKERRSGQGAEIEDLSGVITDIWGYDTWMHILNDGVPVLLSKQMDFHFSADHMTYIQKCRTNMYNILEGAVRSGKTVDHVLAFALELCDTEDKFHLATGSTMANAKLNIGECNGFGLEAIFRGQCRWGSYKDNDALIIRGPFTNFQEKVVIFAGADSSVSYKKIRGNSYGMWIATEINLHHDNTIKEAFNRTLASKKRKIFWDLNPCHPKDPIYTEYIDKYANKDRAGTLIGGYNYQHFTIFDNVNIPKERLEEIVSQYDPDSIWYIRDILGNRSIAEGLCYPKLATSIASKDDRFLISKKDVQEMVRKNQIFHINIGIDFGGNGSGHAFVATAETVGYEKLIFLRSERYVEGDTDPYTGKRLLDIDPVMLNKIFIRFLRTVIRDYGFITKIYCDSAEQVLIRGFRTSLIDEKMGNIKVNNALKSKITDRIFATTSLAAQGRLLYTEDCATYCEAVSMAVWDPRKLDLERLDDGSSDIDTLDASEYSFERDIKKYIKKD